MTDHFDVDSAIRARRTCKQLDGPPLPREALDELFELARWAPNHRLTQPWRFRVLGPEALARLKHECGEGAAKLDRAPTLVVATYVPSPLELHAAEDAAAAACAVYIVLLAATARGYGTYWRTPGVLRTDAGREACGIPAGERVLGLLHFGHLPAGATPPSPARADLRDYVEHLP